MTSETKQLEELASRVACSGVFALAERSLAWARAAGVFTAEADVRVLFAASVFAKLCVPPAATPSQVDVAARLLVVFLVFDDRDVRHVRLEREQPERGLIADIIPGLGAWLAEFGAARFCVPRQRLGFVRSLEDYVAARRQEIDFNLETASIEQCRVLRARTFFASPWLRHWLISMGMDDDALEDPVLRRCEEVATELAYVLNDLVSFEKDAHGGGLSRDVNLVRAHAHSTGCSSSEAIEYYVARHAVLVQRFRQMVREARDARGASDRYLELITWAVVEGNRRAHEALAHMRYGAAAIPILARLESVLE